MYYLWTNLLLHTVKTAKISDSRKLFKSIVSQQIKISVNMIYSTILQKGYFPKRYNIYVPAAAIGRFLQAAPQKSCAY